MLIHQCDRCGSQHKDKSALTSVRIPLQVYRTGPRMAHVEDVSDKSPEMDICDQCRESYKKAVELWIKEPWRDDEAIPIDLDRALVEQAALIDLVRPKDIKERIEAAINDIRREEIVLPPQDKARPSSVDGPGPEQ